jgi:hypothetical protein
LFIKNEVQDGVGFMKINETTGLYENYSLWHVPFWQTTTFHFIIKIFCLIVLIIVVGLLLRMYIRYKKRKKLLPWDQALLDLNHLKQNQKVSAEHSQEFYISLTNIVKNYLNNRYSYDVLGKTDGELVDYLHDVGADFVIIENVKEVIQGSEIIKFANARAAQEQIDNDYNRIIFLIQQTIVRNK